MRCFMRAPDANMLAKRKCDSGDSLAVGARIDQRHLDLAVQFWEARGCVGPRPKLGPM